MMNEVNSDFEYIEGTLFEFCPGLRLASDQGASNEYVYIYRNVMAAKGLYNDVLITFIGYRHVDESTLPQMVVHNGKGRQRCLHRKNVMRKKPMFIMDGVIVILETLDIVRLVRDQGQATQREIEV